MVESPILNVRHPTLSNPHVKEPTMLIAPRLLAALAMCLPLLAYAGQT